jgi:hypothetical protein
MNIFDPSWFVLPFQLARYCIRPIALEACRSPLLRKICSRPGIGCIYDDPVVTTIGAGHQDGGAIDKLIPRVQALYPAIELLYC